MVFPALAFNIVSCFFFFTSFMDIGMGIGISGTSGAGITKFYYAFDVV